MFAAAVSEPPIDWIRASKLSCKEFLSAEFAIEQAEQTYELARQTKVIKTLLRDLCVPLAKTRIFR